MADETILLNRISLIVEKYSSRPLASEADPGLVDLQLLLEEEELVVEGVVGVALCGAGAGWLN